MYNPILRISIPMFNSPQPSFLPLPSSYNNNDANTNILLKRKRRPAGTPDPDAEVVSLSPRTLLESDRYVCEICNQGFQRDQNLQMHRRRHKVPWKLLKRDPPPSSSSSAGGGEAIRKRVYVCPEPSCLHHEPSHALGDLVGIKKHFRRKHSNHKQWVCARCSKAYAVQSDYKAHLKTCGTRGHPCDCGRVFSRVESFIEHQDSCNGNRARPPPDPSTPQPICLSGTASSPSPSPSPSTDTNISNAVAAPTWPPPFFRPNHGLELQLLPTCTTSRPTFTSAPTSDDPEATQLHLSIGPTERLPARDPLGLAAAEKALADEARQQAKRQVELAEQEFANAKMIRKQAEAELEKAYALRDHAAKQINLMLLQITCRACRQQLRPPDHNSVAAAASYVSSSVVTDDDYHGCRHEPKLSSTQ